MRNLPALSALDWLIISIRILWLVALLMVAGLIDRLTAGVGLTLVLWVASTIVMPFITTFVRGRDELAWVFTAVDTILALGLIALSGMFSSPLWSSLLIGPLTIGFSYGLMGSVTVTAAGLLGAELIGLFQTDAGRWTLAPLGIYAGALILAAAVIGHICDQIRWVLTTSGFARHAPAEIDFQRQRLRGIFPMVAELNATLNYERVLDMALEVSASALSDSHPELDRMVGGLLLYDGDQLRIVSGRRLTHADLRVKLPGEYGLIGEAFSTGDPRLGRNPVRDVELRRLVGFHQCRHVLAIPLTAGLETYGIMLFGHPESEYFDAERVELLEAIAQQAMVALQNARLYRDLEQEKERIIEIEEEARNRLARDLHDGPTQSIAAIAMRVNFARRLLEKDQASASKELYKVEDLARRTTKEIRHMLFTLRPLILESRGLVMALKQLAEKVYETHDQEVLVDADPDVAEYLEMGKQGVVFYIAEEAVNNATKYAEAEHIWVRLRTEEDLFMLEVEDDGVGFNVGSIDDDYAQRGSLGMVNMRERTELVNGILQIESAEGAGTLISVIVPMTEESAERLHRTGGVRSEM
ncbi:MAG: GAF domain-containing protein [Anaerolineales bacterium]|nr:GAF domain-containing protein [Anaerolineales bacterium]